MAFLAAVPAWVWTVGSTVVSAVGQMQQANNQQRWYNYNAQVADTNAAMARDRAEADAADKRRQLERLQGSNRASIAKSGVTNSGSALLVMEDTAMQGELDALRLQYGGIVQSNSFKQEAAINRWQAATTRSSLPLQLAGTVLGGAGRAAAQYNALNPRAIYDPSSTAGGARSTRAWQGPGA
jgi:hypothetical protein